MADGNGFTEQDLREIVAAIAVVEARGELPTVDAVRREVEKARGGR